MANPNHLEILKQGVEVWNKWRVKHKYVLLDIQRADLSDADLTGTDLKLADFRGANLSQADLSHAILHLTNLTGANLVGANLYGTYFLVTKLKDANLTGANLMRTTFDDADLSGADLGVAHLGGANFLRATLKGANVKGAAVGRTVFTDIDLRGVKGVEHIHHFWGSDISLSTIFRSQGEIPIVFLRGCGVPEPIIAQIPKLVASLKSNQFYKCFISFGEVDDAFSERLYIDLQANGVLCWRWKEDAKWGKTLMHSIDEAVLAYDKLIIICSEQSLNSPAVIREIERALQKEDDLARQGKDDEVLFPIRLDDYIFTGWKHHRKADVIAKNVGDFRQWESRDDYQKAFDRLLHDLKAEA